MFTSLLVATVDDEDDLSVGHSLSEQNSLIHSKKLSPYFIAFSSAISSSSVRLSTVVGLRTDGDQHDMVSNFNINVAAFSVLMSSTSSHD